MSTRSLVERLSTLEIVFAGALILVFAGSAIGLSARTLEREEAAFLTNAASHMAESLDREWREEGDLRRAAESAISEDEPAGVDFDVFDSSGRKVFSTRAVASSKSPQHQSTLREPLTRGGWIVASVSTEPRRRAMAALATAIALTGLPLFIAAAVLSRQVARRALRPLSRITADADEATRRGFLARLEHASDPAEVATLAAAFDRLFKRLDETLRAEQHFTQDAAHELRTPLTVLSGELEYALQDSSMPERHRAGMERALGEARTLTELVEALLLLRRADFDPVGDAGTVPVNIADLIRDLALEFAERLPARVQDFSIDAVDEAFVTGHAMLLGAALRNLLSNAFKFTHAGQRVHVTVSTTGERCVVVVEDGGPGIPLSDRERVFDPFFRGSEARGDYEGVGLGLPILRRVARAHGGDVRLLESALGGARFELSLPAWASQTGPW